MKNRCSISDLKSLAFIFLLSSAYLYPFVRVLWGIRDEGSIVYSAQLVAEGALPYRDFFEIAGPATYYWLAFFFKLFGTKLVVARGLVLITGAFSITLIYWMTRRLYRGPFDYLPAMFYLLISYPIWPVSNHHWDSNFFALLAVVTYILWEDARQKRCLIIAGFLAGITSCFMVQKGFLVFLAFIGVLIIRWKWPCGKKIRIMNDLATISTAYFSVGLLVSFLFYLSGGLGDLIYDTLIYPSQNYHKINVLPYGYGLQAWFLPHWKQVLNLFLPPTLGNHLGLFVLVPFFTILILPVLVMALAAGLYTNSVNRSRLINSPMLIYWSSGMALWASELHRMDIIHLVYGSPILLIILFTLWNVLCGEKRVIYSIGLVLISFSLIVFGSIHAAIALSANHQFVTRRGLVYSFQEDRILKFLHEKIEPGSKVFVYPYYPMYYFLANIRNPTRFNVLMYQYNSKEQFKEAITALEQKKVKYVLWDTGVSGPKLKKWFPQYTHPPKAMLELESYVEEHYQEVEVPNDIRILRRKEG